MSSTAATTVAFFAAFASVAWSASRTRTPPGPPVLAEGMALMPACVAALGPEYSRARRGS